MIITSRDINGTVQVPSSKSVLHRLIILASLCTTPTKIYCRVLGNDVLATIDCVTKLSAKVQICDGYIIVYPISQKVDNVCLDVKESGSTLRFLLPVVASLGVRATFIGSPSIISRPIKPIVDLLCSCGVSISSCTLPLTISGKLQKGNYKIDGSLSSQFASGMLLALANIGDSTLEITNATSIDYLNITTKCIKQFGGNICYNNRYVFAQRNIVSCNKIVAEGDWSSACFILAMGVLYGKTTVTNLDINSMQGDKIIVNILKDMGGKITICNGEIIAEKSNLYATTVDIKNYPDIATILAVLMANAKGKSVIKSVDRLKIKESDRLKNIIEMLDKIGVKTEYFDDTLTIYGSDTKLATLQGENDHRVAISAIVALTKTGGIVEGVRCIDKSYPTFLQDYKTLGGCYEI